MQAENSQLKLDNNELRGDNNSQVKGENQSIFEIYELRKEINQLTEKINQLNGENYQLTENYRIIDKNQFELTEYYQSKEKSQLKREQTINDNNKKNEEQMQQLIKEYKDLMCEYVSEKFKNCGDHVIPPRAMTLKMIKIAEFHKFNSEKFITSFNKFSENFQIKDDVYIKGIELFHYVLYPKRDIFLSSNFSSLSSAKELEDRLEDNGCQCLTCKNNRIQKEKKISQNINKAATYNDNNIIMIESFYEEPIKLDF